MKITSFVTNAGQLGEESYHFSNGHIFLVNDKTLVTERQMEAIPTLIGVCNQVLVWWELHKHDPSGGYKLYDEPKFVTHAKKALLVSYPSPEVK